MSFCNIIAILLPIPHAILVKTEDKREGGPNGVFNWTRHCGGGSATHSIALEDEEDEA